MEGNARKFRVLPAVLQLLLILAVCSCERERHPENPSAVLKIAVRSGIYADVLRGCLEEFEFSRNVRCEVEEFGEDELRERILAGGGLDLCMVDGSWMASFASRGVLADLAGLGYSLDDDIIGATTAISRRGGGLYLAPWFGNVTVLLYNRIMLREAGISPGEVSSLEDLLRVSDFQRGRHNLGFMYRGDTANNVVVDFLPVLCACGGWVVDKENRPTVDTEQFRMAMIVYRALVGTGRAAKRDDLVAAIANKSAALGVGWPGWYTPTRNSSMDYVPFPGRLRRTDREFNASVYGIWALGIPSDSAQKELAAALLSHLMDAGVQRRSVEFGGVPCRYSSLADDDVVSRFPQYAAVRRALESGVYRPVMEDWPEFCAVLGDEISLILDGAKPISTGLSDAQRRLESIGRQRPD